MNYSMVMYIIGWILNFEAAFMLPSCLVAVIYQEKCGISFLITMAAALVIGIPLTVRKPKNKDFHSREGFASVALGWIVRMWRQCRVVFSFGEVLPTGSAEWEYSFSLWRFCR